MSSDGTNRKESESMEQQDEKRWLKRWFPRIEKKYIVLAIAVVVALYFVFGAAGS